MMPVTQRCRDHCIMWSGSAREASEIQYWRLNSGETPASVPAMADAAMLHLPTKRRVRRCGCRRGTNLSTIADNARTDPAEHTNVIVWFGLRVFRLRNAVTISALHQHWIADTFAQNDSFVIAGFVWPISYPVAKHQGRNRKWLHTPISVIPTPRSAPMVRRSGPLPVIPATATAPSSTPGPSSF
jgi:hypothetical protein